ncbi:hypothetical protein [Marinobacter sp. OP 3.4]|uniref:hypothetical protein n=1 Tax=Marinobacter sp. OP 3.4 TaxID=3076501 RepID=UPI002E1E92E2
MSSMGQRLLHEVGLRQGTYFRVSDVGHDVCLAWLSSLARPDLRGRAKLMPENAILAVISQDCDIACRTDGMDPCVELYVLRPIRDRDVFHGNQFVQSVRKLQLNIEGQWYEAKAEAAVTVDKGELLEVLRGVELAKMPEIDRQCFVRWRTNRYSRTALPDKFNEHLFKVLPEALSRLDGIAKVEGDEGRSYIRALYVWLDPVSEADYYDFELFALLRNDVGDEVLAAIQDAVEEFAERLSDISGFNDLSEMYADRDGQTAVSYLTNFVKLNVDAESLKSGDLDTGVDPV